MPSKPCPSCRAENRDIAVFCRACGVRIEKLPEPGVPAASGGASWWAGKQATGVATGGVALLGLMAVAWWLGMRAPEGRPRGAVALARVVSAKSPPPPTGASRDKRRFGESGPAADVRKANLEADKPKSGLDFVLSVERVGKPGPEPGQLTAIAIRNGDLKPGERMTLAVGRESSVAALERSRVSGDLIILVKQKRAETSHPVLDDLEGHATVARIVSRSRNQRGHWDVVAEGLRRVEVASAGYPYGANSPLMVRLSRGAVSGTAGKAVNVCSPDYFTQAKKWTAQGLGCKEGFSSLAFSAPATVNPGQQVAVSMRFRRCDAGCNPNAVIYSSFLGDWQPDSPLMMRKSYFMRCGESAVDKVVLAAPTEAGRYRIRWTLCMAFAGIKKFCGDGPAGSSENPGICPYVEKTFSVRARK